jgi:hypothetical protein
MMTADGLAAAVGTEAAKELTSALGKITEPVIMKSFRLHRTAPPIRYVTDYKPEELAEFRAAFRPVAERYRCRMRMGLVLIFFTAAFVLMSLVFSEFFWAGSFACWLASVLVASLSPVPDCPACHNPLDKGVGPYCPQCGARALQRGDWFHVPSCTSCGRKLFRGGKGGARHWRIRTCTHCGVYLDENGI